MVAGFMASEKVAVGETLSATPVAPGAGVRDVMVGAPLPGHWMRRIVPPSKSA